MVGMAGRRARLLAKLEQSPKAVRPELMETVLRGFGYERKRQKGSHRVYVKPGVFPLVVPYRRPHLGRVYVEQVIERLQSELREEGS